MPMPIGNDEEYDKIISISWYTPDKAREELRFVFPTNVLRSRFLQIIASHVSYPSRRCILPAASTFAAFSTNSFSFWMTTFNILI